MGHTLTNRLMHSPFNFLQAITKIQSVCKVNQILSHHNTHSLPCSCHNEIVLVKISEGYFDHGVCSIRTKQKLTTEKESESFKKLGGIYLL